MTNAKATSHVAVIGPAALWKRVGAAARAHAVEDLHMRSSFVHTRATRGAKFIGLTIC